MEKRGLRVWGILAWIALGSIVLWTVLKIVGIINTPLLIEYYPFLAVSYFSDIKGLKNSEMKLFKRLVKLKQTRLNHK